MDTMVVGYPQIKDEQRDKGLCDMPKVMLQTWEESSAFLTLCSMCFPIKTTLVTFINAQ